MSFNVTSALLPVMKSPAFWSSFGVGTISLLFYIRREIQGYWYDRTAKIIKTDMTGKTILVTGGNSGIGLGTAVEFAKLNANIIITCRNDKKGKDSINIINTCYPNNISKTDRGKVSYKILDTGNIKSTNNFINEILNDYKSSNLEIDYLVLNAGIPKPYSQNTKTNDNLHQVFQVNYYGHWLITYKLREMFEEISKNRVTKLNENLNTKDDWILKYGAPIRIISVSSGAHTSACYGIPKNKNKNINSNNIYDEYFDYISKQSCSYSESKLFQILHMNHLQKLFNDNGFGDNIWCCTITPGMVRTPIVGKFSSVATYASTLFYPVYWFLSRSVHMGCQVILHTIGNNDPNIKGGYYSNCLLKPAGSQTAIQSPEDIGQDKIDKRRIGPKEATDLWEQSVKLAQENAITKKK